VKCRQNQRFFNEPAYRRNKNFLFLKKKSATHLEKNPAKTALPPYTAQSSTGTTSLSCVIPQTALPLNPTG
jgi:hypothetical protein